MNLEAIAAFHSAHEAHLARGRLEAEGISVIITGEHLADLTTAYGGGGGAVTLEVPADQADRARKILSRDYSIDVETDAGGDPPGESERTCPDCGSASVLDLRAGHKPSLWSILFGAPGNLIGSRFKCLTCGQRWR